MNLNEYASARRTRGNYKVPKSVQQCIPIDHIYPDGIWQSGEVYSQMWSVSDINYDMLSDEKKKEIQTLYGVVYAGIPADCWGKFCVISQRMDEGMFRRSILMRRGNDNNDFYRAEYNRLMVNRVKAAGNVLQQKYLIISTNKHNIKEARDRLRHM